VGEWIPSGNWDTFRSGLQQLSSTICRDWRLVQTVEERIVPNFSFDDTDDWQPLPELTVCTDVTAATLASTAQQQKIREGQRKQPGRGTQPLTAERVKVVWPAFLTADPQQQDEDDTGLLANGYVLRHTNLKDAEDKMSRGMPEGLCAGISLPRPAGEDAIRAFFHPQEDPPVQTPSDPGTSHRG
jgi:hypothetical protein